MNVRKIEKIYISKLNAINKKSKKLLQSNKYIIVSLIWVTIFAFIQILMYAFGKLTSGDMGIDPRFPEWITILSLVVQVIAGSLSVVSFTKNQRMDKDFYKWAAPAILLYLIHAIILTLWFKVLTIIFIFSIRTIQHFVWNNEKNKDKIITNTKWYINLLILIVTLSLSGLLGWAMNHVPEDNPFANPRPYLDAIIFLLTVTGQLYLIKRDIFVHTYLITTSILNLYLMISIGQIMVPARGIITLITTILGLLFWQAQYFEAKLKKEKVD